MVQSILLNYPSNSVTIYDQSGNSSDQCNVKSEAVETVKIITDLFWSLSLLKADYNVEIKITPQKEDSAKEECLFSILKSFYKRNSRLVSIVRYIAEKKIFPEASAFERLSPMQKIIVSHIQKGLTYTDIAKKLNLSPHTVNGHRKNAIKVLGVTNIKGLLTYLERFSIE